MLVTTYDQNGGISLMPENSLSIESWRILRIQGEFVEAIEALAKLPPAVTVFGSARLKEDNLHYQSAVQCGEQLTHAGFAVITGGGPGIMEAANRGAYEAGGTSVGLNISLPQEQDANPYQTLELDFRYFFIRKVMFVKYARGFVIYPGGFGTLDEFFESLTLMQTLKIQPFPVVLVGKKYWSSLIDWMRKTLAEEFKTISPEDLDLFSVVDDPAEAVQIIHDHYTGLHIVGQNLPRFDSDEDLPTGEGTRLGKPPRRHAPPDKQ